MNLNRVAYLYDKKATRSNRMSELPIMTPLQAKQLAWLLCDPFLTVDECLKLVGVQQPINEESEREQLAA